MKIIGWSDKAGSVGELGFGKKRAALNGMRRSFLYLFVPGNDLICKQGDVFSSLVEIRRDHNRNPVSRWN